MMEKEESLGDVENKDVNYIMQGESFWRNLRKTLHESSIELQASLTLKFMETYDFRKTPMCNARRCEHMKEIFHRISRSFPYVYREKKVSLSFN